jgi:outer membrane protein assembly factor BamB
VKRVPIVMVAVLAAMVLSAVLLKWSSRHGAAAASLQGLDRVRLDAGTSASTAAGLGAGPPPAAGAPEKTSMIHGDPRHTHRSIGRVTTRAPEVAWVRDVGGPVEAQVTSSFDEQTLYAASLGGSLTALGRDGAVRWTLALGDRVYATPCVAADGTIYVGSDAKKFDAVTPDGKVKWSLDTDGDADTGAAIAGDGSVVFAAGRTVYDVSAAGLVHWRFAAKRKVFASPAVAGDGRVFAGSQDHHVYAIAPDGKLLWSADLGADVDGSPAIDDQDGLYVGTDGDEVVRLDPADGRVVWRTNVGGYARGALSIARNGDVLAGVYGPKPRAVRLLGENGEVRGAFPIQGTGARDFGVHGGALEDAAGTLLFGTQDDAVYAVDTTGNMLWRFSTAGDVDAPVTLLSDGTVVIGSDDGTVTALRPAG